MTIVEFFDRSPVDNMVTCLTCRPDRIIFLGEESELSPREEHFYRFLDETDNFDTLLNFQYVNTSSLRHIVKTLTAIVEEYDDVCFDLTGGSDLCLVAAGIVRERYPEKNIQLHRFDILQGRIYDCDGDGTVAEGDLPTLTVEQNVILHGGAIITTQHKEGGTAFWDLNLDFARDLNEMWKLCKKTPSVWNYLTTALGVLDGNKTPDDDPLSLSISIISAKAGMAAKGLVFSEAPLFDDLVRLGWISNFSLSDREVRMHFKDEQVKRCLIKAGTVLELKTYLTAMQLEQGEGDYFFNDGMTGVQLDWNGEIFATGAIETQNEIDVLLMRGLVPVFISCKNGNVDENELYKLQTVAQQFGGRYAKKILVAGHLGKGSNAREFFLQRAKDMGIGVIEFVHELSPKEFSAQLRKYASDE